VPAVPATRHDRIVDRRSGAFVGAIHRHADVPAFAVPAVAVGRPLRNSPGSASWALRQELDVGIVHCEVPADPSRWPADSEDRVSSEKVPDIAGAAPRPRSLQAVRIRGLGVVGERDRTRGGTRFAGPVAGLTLKEVPGIMPAAIVGIGEL